MSQAPNTMCPVEEQYRPPAGYYDFPYIYVVSFDEIVAAGGSDPLLGKDFILNQRTLQGDSLFVLRKVTRFPVDTTDDFMLYTPEQNQRFSKRINGVAETVFPVVPEAVHPPSGSVYYDVAGWASSTQLSFGGIGPYLFTSQILFQGVRRFRGDLINPQPSGYQYSEKPFSYTYDLTLDWTYLEPPYANLSPAPRRQFQIPVQDHDFELQRISVVQRDGVGGPKVTNNIDSPSFRVTLYDPDRREMMSEPVYVAAINQSMKGNSRLFPAFPVPSMVYRANGQILFDVVSHLDDPVGGGVPAAVEYSVVFHGVRRVAQGSVYGGSGVGGGA